VALCYATDCPVEITDRTLFCRRHWNKVTKAQLNKLRAADALGPNELATALIECVAEMDAMENATT